MAEVSIISIVTLVLIVMVAGGFYIGRTKALQCTGGKTSSLHSLPNYYGYYIAVWTGLPAFLILAFYGIFANALVTQMTLADLRGEASSLNRVLEDKLDIDADYINFNETALTLEGQVETLNAEINRLRSARDNARDPERLEQLREEQVETLNLSTAANSALRERRNELVQSVMEEAQLGGASATATAGFVLSQAPKEQRQLFLSDARNMVDGEFVSRDSEDLRTTAAMMSQYRWQIRLAVGLVTLLVAGLAFLRTRSQIAPEFRARNQVERLITILLLSSSVLAILTTIGIVLSLLFESMRFFSMVSITEFLFGLQWSPQIAIRADQIGQSGAFGAIPLFAGTAMITAIAMMVAVPIGLFSAIYLSEYAGPKFRSVAKPVLEILAGIPTVVFGFFALLTVGPAIRALFSSLGFESVVTQSALSAGLVMGVMIIPFISSLSDDVINAVPQSLRDGSYAMGATRSETVSQVVVPAALPGIIGAILLAVSRAVGETMIVVMAAGQGANLTANPLESVTTITVQIVMLLTGDQEFDSAKTLSAFALGLVLFVMTLIMNVIALRVVQKYREKYD